MSGQETGDNYRLSKNRLEALFDAIFAFAMTLLVTGFVVPPIPTPEAMVLIPAYIYSMHPEFLSFIIAFFVLSSFWLAHHRQFHFVHKIDPVLVWITLFILALTVLMPFTTNISGDYPEVQIAVELFHINLFSLGILFLIHWWYLVNHPELTSNEISRNDATNGMHRVLVMPFVSFLGFTCSFISPSWSMAIYLFTPLLFFINHRYFTVGTRE